MDKFEASNYDLVNIVTPIGVQVLERLLRESNYDEMETEFLVKGLNLGLNFVTGDLPIGARQLGICLYHVVPPRICGTI